MTKIQLLQAQKINAMKQKIENKKSVIGNLRKELEKLDEKEKKVRFKFENA